MKLDGRQLKIITIAVALFFNVLMTAHCQPFALLTLSNAVPTNITEPTNIELETNRILPLIEMHDVPINSGIENLARGAGINYVIDARLAKWWSMPDADGYATHEPTLNFRWRSLTAKQALVRLLGEHHLVLADDPLTSVARITYANQVVNPGDAGLLGSDTNLIPLIQFNDVPITTGLENLARQAGINYALDPKIGYGQPDKHGQIKTEPLLSLRWEDVTAKQAFVAICENYDLVISKDPTSGIVLIRAKYHPLTNFLDASLLGGDTNLIPLIQFSDVPITTGLEHLARQAGIDCKFDPETGYRKLNKQGLIKTEPILSIRWEGVTAKQAFVALCENYDYAIVKDSSTGIIRIQSKD